MKVTLKPLSADAIPRALEKAERYRLLNQPWAAESICEDILRVQPAHQAALRILLLTHTDQFTGESGRGPKARAVCAKLSSMYEQAYYSGIIQERRAKAKLDARHPGIGHLAYELLREAMTWYEKAEQLKPAGNDDAILRWNTCARMLNDTPHLAPRDQDAFEHVIGE